MRDGRRSKWIYSNKNKEKFAVNLIIIFSNSNLLNSKWKDSVRVLKKIVYIFSREWHVTQIIVNKADWVLSKAKLRAVVLWISQLSATYTPVRADWVPLADWVLQYLPKRAQVSAVSRLSATYLPVRVQVSAISRLSAAIPTCKGESESR